MDLHTLYQKLKALELEIPEYKYYRYFDCDGSPYDCDTFLIGINPANGLPFEKEFWDYCNEDSGFNLAKWLTDYKQERIDNNRSKSSLTRIRIELLREKLAPKKLLNCNVFSKNTPRLKDLQDIDRNIDIFKILLGEIIPENIILHGGITKKVFEKIVPDYSSKLADWQLHIIQINNKDVKIISVPHLFNMAFTPEKNSGRNIEKILDVLFG
jgi:hypothetical protein